MTSRFNPELISKNMVVLAGIPFDGNSSWITGTAKAPDSIREALFSESTNLSTESGIDLSQNNQWIDAGDVMVDDFINDLHSSATSILEKGAKPIFLGGDHSITYPLVKAFSDSGHQCTILHLDAHSDLYHDFDNNPYSHASPFARIMESGLAKRLIQVGIRTMTPHQKKQAERFDVEITEMKDLSFPMKFKTEGPVYLSLDMDVLDPAYAPGISHYEPGGMSTREVISVIQAIDGNLIGADIVELNPERDRNQLTAMTASKFLKEIICKMLL